MMKRVQPSEHEAAVSAGGAATHGPRVDADDATPRIEQRVHGGEPGPAEADHAHIACDVTA